MILPPTRIVVRFLFSMWWAVLAFQHAKYRAHQIREPFPTCFLYFQHVSWQIQNGISCDSPLFYKAQFCGISRFWLSCEQLCQFELCITVFPTDLLLASWLCLISSSGQWLGRPPLGKYRYNFLFIYSFFILPDLQYSKFCKDQGFDWYLCAFCPGIFW